MERDVLIILQAIGIAFFLFILAIWWARLIAKDEQPRLRRDGKIVGQNFILTSIAFVGTFALIYDQPGVQQLIIATHQTLYYLLMLLFVIWIICSQLVRDILKKPAGQPSKFVIGVTRFFINYIGIISVVVCRFLLTKTFISLLNH